ncbi:hypothetical protein Patl1_09075 [Pistacia atlantica]|uniref:Uncharacterized protein n=1 Tax=Pistacia atlantica TaxID=434234 RepID=A0ACC1ALB6_9ROSI|nr:hypothetical protein Patl1_09075 [Pistacia atlantica]
MLPRIIFCTAIALATLAVILLALVSPVVHKRQSKNHSSPWLALSLYIQPPHIASSKTRPVTKSDGGAFIFHHTLTEGPENTSRASWKSSSLSVQANQVNHKDTEKLTVVGGTGSFAFARGHAVFALTDRQTYHVKLQLKFPNPSQTIPG